MNVGPTQTPNLAPAAAPRRLDVTVSDGGVQTRAEAAHAVAPKAGPVPAASPASTSEVAATLSGPEQQALSERFAGLPEQGVTAPGYDVRGRAASAPPAGLQGRLLDITG